MHKTGTPIFAQIGQSSRSTGPLQCIITDRKCTAEMSTVGCNGVTVGFYAVQLFSKTQTL